MLQTNLIFGIQKKIKAGSAHAHKMGLVEESTEYKRHSVESTEPILESSFVAGIYEQASAAKKKEEGRKTLVTEAFHLTKARKKLEKDINYFNYLYENFVDDVFKDQYKMLLESVFEDTIKLYQECDVTPRLVSPALDSNELNENQIIDIYRNRLNETIKNEYTKPLLSGKITEIYENEIRDITRKLIEEGSTIDMNQVKVYLPFEETVYKFNKEILVPEIAERRVEAFMESMTEDYLEFIEESAEDILQKIEKKIKLLTSLISPNIFDKAVDAEGVEAPKMAGISITIDKNFDGDAECDDGICPDEVASTDPEAAEEMADEEEAIELDAETGDINDVEEGVRDNMDLANDAEDYENTESMEEEAEESAAEETAEHPEQPGAVEMELAVQDGDAEPGSGMVVNTDDVDIQGDGNDFGEDPAVGATLPGGAESVGEEVDSDEIGDEIDELQAKEEVDSDDGELSEEEEDKLKVVSEGTTQDKNIPKAQNTHNNKGTLPGGGTTQDKGIAGASINAKKLNNGKTGQDKKPAPQGGAGKSSGSMPGGGTTQDKNIPKAKNAGNSKGTLPGGRTTQDKKPGSQGGAPQKSGSMPGGNTTQDKHLS
jgi:hypothetical protein